MIFRILGPLEMEADGESVDLGPRKQRSLFGLLLMNHNRVIATDRILEELWGDDAHGKENALWVYISRLRSILDEHSAQPVLVTKDHGYSVEIEPDALDSNRFEQLTAQGSGLVATDPQTAAGTLREALALWHGNALEDFAYDEWAQPYISRLTELRNQCIGDRIEADLKRGVSGELIGELERLVDERSLDERPVSQLMLAQYRAGRQADALRTFERYRRFAGEELGIDPSPELRRLEEQVLLHDSRIQKRADRQRHDSPGGVPIGENPFKGLEAFQEDDAGLFFGRDQLVGAIISRLSDHPIITVVGPSGCGKSSAVRSGMVPALRKGAIPGSDAWLIATIVPGSNPFAELEAGLLRSNLDAPETLRSYFDGSPDEIMRAVLRISPNDRSTVVIVIDQLEELFTLCDRNTADRFFTAIVEAAADPHGRVRFVLTLRSDFYDKPLAHPGFGAAMSSGVINVVPMAPEELEQAASQPAARVGVRLEPALEAALVGDVLGQPGALPLFQFALTDLFDRRVGETLTLAAYRDMGAIQGTLSRRADQIYDHITVHQQAAARQVFLRLVTISDSQTKSRRRVDASELLELDLDVTDLQIVLDSYGQHRLLSFDWNDVSGSPTVEVAHEALLEYWERFSGWIDESRQDLSANERLTAATTEWNENHRKPGYLLTGARLERYETWAESSTMVLARSERDFLTASVSIRDEQLAAENDRIARESATSRRAKLTMWGLAAVVFAVAIVGGYFAWASLQPEGPTVAYIHDGNIDSDIERQLQSGYDRADQAFDFVARDYAVLSNMSETIRKAADDGADLIIVGSDFMGFVQEIAADYSTTQFVVLAEGSAFDTLPNVSTVVFENVEGAYMMGVAAALSTRTGTVGFIGATQQRLLQDFSTPYIAGVQATDATIDVLVDWVSSDVNETPNGKFVYEGFARPDLAREAALNQFRSGADVIFTAAGESGAGTIQAAADYSSEIGQQVWAIGVDSDEGFTANDALDQYVLTSMVKQFGDAMYQSVAKYLNGTLEPVTEYSLATGGVTYSTYAGYIDDVKTELESVERALSNDQIVIPTVSAYPSTWRADAQQYLDVTYDGESCRPSRPPIARVGETMSITFVNTTPEEASMGVVAMPGNVTDEQLAIDTRALGDPFSAMMSNGGLTLVNWTIPANSEYEIRTSWPGNSFEAAVILCWSDEIFDSPGPISDIFMVSQAE